VADPINFFYRLASSIDHCVSNFVLIKSKKAQINDAINLLSNSPYILNLTVIQSPHNLFGVSEGWNMGLRAFPESSWYLICAYDVEFLPNQLKHFSRRFHRDIRIEPPSNITSFNFVFSNWQNLNPGGFNLFALTKEVVDNVGYFDENFFPAFYEDNDYSRRYELWGKSINVLKWCTYMNIKPYHGVYTLEKDNTTALKYISGTSYLNKVTHIDIYVLY
jgi:hypothetical protein